MKHSILKIFILMLISLTASCSSEMDFDQVSDLVLKPVYVVNWIYFDIPANRFVTDGIENIIIEDTSETDIFKDDFVQENIKKVEVFYEITNTIRRDYSIELIYLDKDSNTLHTSQIDIPAYTSIQKPITLTEIFEDSELDLLKQTTSVAFKIQILPGQGLSEFSSGSLKMRSDITGYLEVK